jgi:hypothetical protein
MKFDYGDEVMLIRVEGGGDLTNRVCAVVGITPIETEEQSSSFGYPVGTTMYTVEFGDGSDADVPGDSLKLSDG